MADDKNRPTHRLVLVSERQIIRDHKPTTRTTYSEICGLWPTEKGNLSGEIPSGMSLTGRVIITPADKAPEQGEPSDSYLSDK